LSFTEVNDLSFVEHLPDLQSLNLSSTKVYDLSPLIPLFKKGIKVSLEKTGKGILLNGCPIITPPSEIVEQGNEAILRYFAQGEVGYNKLYEAKLIIVGEPGAGKTTLMKKLIDENYILKPEEQSTIGVDVHESWVFDYVKDKQIGFKANIWDFGGQVIQYMTHQFFLTPRSLYILVADDRKQHSNFPYWFRVIDLLGKSEDGQHSPILVILNENNNSAITNFDINRYGIQYPHLNITKHEVNLAVNDMRFFEMRDKIQDMMSRLHHIGSQLPQNWISIRERLKLRSLKDNHISVSEYFKICAENEINDESYCLDLSRYLHDIGVILHFQDDNSGLRDFIILNPEWAVDAVYSVLSNNTVKNNKGCFNRNFVFDLWEQKGYNYIERGHLLNLMSKDNFEICYRTSDKNNGEYIAPQLLENVKPEYEWDNSGGLKFRYQYPFMPPGILTRLIVRLSEYILDENGNSIVWEKGVVISKDDCKAQIIEDETIDEGLKVIDIEVIGHIAEKKYVLRLIREEVEAIHKKSFTNLTFDRLVSCTCDKCTVNEIPYFHRYSVLENFMKIGTPSQCQLSGDSISVGVLLEGVFTKRKSDKNYDIVPEKTEKKSEEKHKIKVFFSYSKEDKELRDELDKYLRPLKNKITTWYDQDITAGEEWDAKIKNELRSSDIVLCLISVDFINTDYIIYQELPIMLERESEGLTKVIPVILRECPWIDTDLVKFQALPGKGEPITKYNNSEEAYMEVYNGLKKVVEELAAKEKNPDE